MHALMIFVRYSMSLLLYTNSLSNYIRFVDAFLLCFLGMWVLVSSEVSLQLSFYDWLLGRLWEAWITGKKIRWKKATVTKMVPLEGPSCFLGQPWPSPPCTDKFVQLTISWQKRKILIMQDDEPQVIRLLGRKKNHDWQNTTI